LMNFDLICAWMATGALIALGLHGFYRRTPLFDALSFSALGAVLCGLAGSVGGLSDVFATSLCALGGALLGAAAAPRTLVRRSQLNIRLNRSANSRAGLAD
jgi:hypothetical protein